MSSKSAAPCDTPAPMSQVASADMRRPSDWGAQKGIPAWKVAAASQLAGWTQTTPVTEAGFDAGIEAVDGHSAARPPGAPAAQKGSGS